MLRTLDELVALVERSDAELYVRWSKGPDADAAQRSRDALTGIELPGLSANPLRVESWWGDRPLRLWLARRLYDYRHLRDRRGPGVHAWVLEGEERGRGPDNEPLVRCRRAVAWIADEVHEVCTRMVEEQDSAEWGPLDRGGFR
ncbi:DUF6098 family protein [Allokutzneria albata]|uniref:DUF6098 family protein n=1 Tax=Allokutzneria albata TaxID=211114 RepID=UPI000A80351D|nr:DUF6098 family protein [Allokutzneria albata]